MKVKLTVQMKRLLGNQFARRENSRLAKKGNYNQRKGYFVVF